MRFAIKPTACIFALGIPAAASAQLRIVQYNTSDSARVGMETILEQIGNEQVNGFAKPIDILLMQEQSGLTSINTYVAKLNTIYGAGTYVAAPYVGTSSGGGLPAMVYRAASVDLIGSPVPLGTVNSSANARSTVRYQLRPDGYTNGAADFFIYNSHYKASDDEDGINRARRNAEATTNRGNANGLGAGAHFIYAGDLNLYDGNEPALATLKAPGDGQATDVLTLPVNWSVSAHRYAHTQSPATVQAYPSQVTAGMDDRFDYQLMSNAFRDNEGISYITGSYRAFGNNGTHPLGGAINNASNSWAPAGVVNPANVKTVLTQVTDHIPVVVDYQIPASMQVAVDPNFSTVIVNASAHVDVTVTNNANVVAAIGADELDYALSGSGALVGSVNGVDQALGVGNAHTLQFDTSTPGVKSGVVNVSSSSQAVRNGTFTQNVNTTVLAHANASFAASPDQDLLSIDFGIRARGSTSVVADFAIHNLAHPSGFTAAMDLDAIDVVGDTTGITVNFDEFSNLVAGDNHAFAATLNTGFVGIFEASYAIHLSDEDLPGAASLSSLNLVVAGRIAMGGDANLDNVVNATDFTILATNFGTSGRIWQTADFTNDGIVNANDFSMLATNFGLTATGVNGEITPQDWANLAAVVPEPSSALLVSAAVGFSSLLRRRRRGRIA